MKRSGSKTDAQPHRAGERRGNSSGRRGGCAGRLIDEVGGMSQALNKLHEMIRQDREKCGKIDNDSFF